MNDLDANTQKQNLFLKILIHFSRLFVGLIFTFSGFVKLVDPLGTVYKFGDYFKDAFHMPELDIFSFPLAFVMNAVEFFVGISLLFNIKTKISSSLALLFMILFTPLTLYIAVFDNVHDCGCFGDALVLSNWDTFYKNLIIIVFAVVVYFYRNKFTSLLSDKLQWAALSFFVFFAVAFEVYNYRHLPLIDFRPYKVGNYLPDQMIIPEGETAPVYGYNYTLTHKETSETKTIDSDSYMKDGLWRDTLWAITNTSESFLIRAGYVPPIHDLRFEAVEDAPDETYTKGDDLLETSLADENLNFWIVMYDMQLTEPDQLKQVSKLIEFCKAEGYKFYCLTSTSLDEAIRLQGRAGVSFPIYNTDPITLKTIVRSNPGYVLLQKGTVLAKWNTNDFTADDIQGAINVALKKFNVK